MKKIAVRCLWTLAAVFFFGFHALMFCALWIGPREAAKPERREKPQWFTLEKESEEDAPDSPEQVLITIRTRNGKRWVATWEELPKAHPR